MFELALNIKTDERDSCGGVSRIHVDLLSKYPDDDDDDDEGHDDDAHRNNLMCPKKVLLYFLVCLPHSTEPSKSYYN